MRIIIIDKKTNKEIENKKVNYIDITDEKIRFQTRLNRYVYEKKDVIIIVQED